MLQVNDIENIGEIIEPEKLEMTFSTLGWYVLYSVVLLILLLIIYKFIKYWNKNKYRRSAINHLRNKRNSISIAEVSEVVKIVAIQSYGRSEVANLSLGSWLEFLNSKSKVTFNKESFEFIYSNKKIDKKDLDSFVDNAISWISKHKV